MNCFENNSQVAWLDEAINSEPEIALSKAMEILKIVYAQEREAAKLMEKDSGNMKLLSNGTN